MILTRLGELSKRLEQTVKKYPQGKVLFAQPQDRFIKIAVTDGLAQDAETWALPQWLGASLAYWVDAVSCQRGDESRGRVMLMRISKVTWLEREKTGTMVKVKHKLKGPKSMDLFIVFQSKDDAEQWAYHLWMLITTLRQYLKDKGIATEDRRTFIETQSSRR